MPGATVADLVSIGEKTVEDKSALIYTKKVKGVEVQKGISFPVCISINDCVCHNCPMKDDESATEAVQDGDMVKIDLGVHVDGY